jgi:chromosome segregation ATPase
VAISATAIFAAVPRVVQFRAISTIAREASSSHCDDAMIRRARMTLTRFKTLMDRRFTRLERALRSHVADTGTHFTSVDANFAAIDVRFAAVDTRFDAVDTRFDAVDSRLDAMDARFDAMDRRFDAMDARFDSAERRADLRMGTLERRLDSVDDKLETIVGILRDGIQHHQRILDEHETRLSDIERQSGA